MNIQNNGEIIVLLFSDHINKFVEECKRTLIILTTEQLGSFDALTDALKAN
jgi:hypothetical protein